MRTIHIQFDSEFEEVSSELWFGKVSIEADCHPAEPMVRYYRDGSGYPGCPASFDGQIVSVVIEGYYDHNGDEITEMSESTRNQGESIVRNFLSDDEIMHDMIRDELECRELV